MSGKKGRKLIRAGSQVRYPITADRFGVGVVREIDKKTPGWRALVFTGTRVGGEEVREWFPHVALTPTGQRVRWVKKQ